MHSNNYFKKGLSLVEIVVASAIILVAVVALLNVHNLYLKIAFSNANAVKAAYLAEEGVEAVRWLREVSWADNIATLSVGTNYGLARVNGNWQVSVSNKYVENFERTISLSVAYRDANGDIVTSGGTLDPKTMLVVSSVSWPNGGATTTKSVSTYLTDLYEN